MAQANPAISTMLDHMEKNSTSTVHQINQVKPATSTTLSLPLAFPLSITPAMAHIDSSTLLLYSRHPGSPSTYSIYVPRHRFSHTLSGTSIPLLPTNSVPITASSWTPFAVSTLYHHKQASPTGTPAPSIHTTKNLTHTQGFSTQYSN